ncbi:hypothetical protein [Acidovorax sp. JG5]|uniref:hypothetical protein n=1 Tax=Acidovorax sp. JG5 TaxID=2822718 RepID=UPI001B31F218|nr:hypothetical protein [Acidovorax sp. JG5]
MDEALIAQTVRDAKSRVVLCIPGFGDVVGAAVIEAHQRLPVGQLLIVVDGTDKAARLGYGHFDAVFQVLQAGVPMRLEQGLRLGVLVADEQGWCFATPPLLVDATMEQATAPNALALNPSQIQPTLSALGYVPPTPKVEPPHAAAKKPEVADKAENATSTEAPTSAETDDLRTIGRVVATIEALQPVQEKLRINPPQAFDVARKVQVFNSLVDFVEIEMTGTQLAHQKVSLPSKLLSVADDATRKRLTTSFSLISPQAKIADKSKELRQVLDAIRKKYTHSVAPYGVVALRTDREPLRQAIERVAAQVKAYSEEIKKELGKEIDNSRKQLVESFLPALVKKPPKDLEFELVYGGTDKPIKEQVRDWINDQLDKCFPAVDSLLQDMEVRLVIKSVTYEMLKEPKFQKLVRDAYPKMDWNKPFEEFSAAPSLVQATLGY